MHVNFEFIQKLDRYVLDGYLDINNNGRYIILKSIPKKIKKELVNFNKEWAKFHFGEDYFLFEN